jgi:proteic killer suppression protein
LIGKFKSKGTEDIFDGKNTKETRKILPVYLHDKARNKMDIMNYANDLNDLKVPPSNYLEKLIGDRKGQYSIRINNQYRICFYWEKDIANEIEIIDYHK